MRRIAPFALLFILSGCSTPVPTEYIDARRLSCNGDAQAFTIADLSQRVGAENGNSPAAAALREYLAGTAGGRAPKDDYRTLATSPDRVVFARGDVDVGIGSVVVELRDGKWETDGVKPCSPMRYRTGSTATSWALKEEPTRGATELTVQVSAEACSSGRSAQGRILAPIIEELKDRIEISFFLSPLQADEHTCEEAPTTTTTVTLRGRVGGRTLYDAGRYPPVEVGKAKG